MAGVGGEEAKALENNNREEIYSVLGMFQEGTFHPGIGRERMVYVECKDVPGKNSNYRRLT